jgi:hypothetical protein
MHVIPYGVNNNEMQSKIFTWAYVRGAYAVALTANNANGTARGFPNRYARHALL